MRGTGGARGLDRVPRCAPCGDESTHTTRSSTRTVAPTAGSRGSSVSSGRCSGTRFATRACATPRRPTLSARRCHGRRSGRRAPGRARRAKLTVERYLLDEWLPNVARTLKPLSFATYQSIVRNQIIPALGHIRLQGLSAAHLNGLYAELEREGLSVATQRLAHAVLHRARRDAVRLGRLVRNPAELADPPARSRARAQAWTASELGRFLEHVRDDRLFALWRLAATTGMRRGELAGLTWRALDLDGEIGRAHV